MNRVELKENAKKSLKGKWGEAILVLVVFGLISLAVSAIGLINNPNALSSPENLSQFLDSPNQFNFGWAQIISSLLSIAVACLLTLGSVSYFLKVSRNEKVSFSELFSKTNLCFLFFGVTIMVAVFTCLWTLLLIIPGIIATYKYSMVNFIMIDNPEIGVFDAIKRSKEMMNGHKLDYFILHLSFLGWALLSALTFGLLLFYVAPYMNVTCANFYNSIKDKKVTD